MNPVTATPKLNAALAKVQAKLPKLERDRTVKVTQKNGGTYEYSYATLPNLTELVLPLLAEHGLSFLAMPSTTADGKLCLRYSLLHESGEEKTGEFPIDPGGGIQMIGGRITYARRYCLTAVVGIAADEDDESRLSDDGPRTAQRAQRTQRRGASSRQDGTATAQRPTPPPASRPPLPGEGGHQSADGVTEPQLTKIAATFGEIGWSDRADRLRAASTLVGRPLESAKDLTKREASTLIETLVKVAADADPAYRLGELLTEVQRRTDPDADAAEQAAAERDGSA
ncbi:MAG: ERF family protein [Microbispora sp.]|nr:ERF family protein [Microbispora sp.]